MHIPFSDKLRIARHIRAAADKRAFAETLPLQSGAMQPCQGEPYGDTYRNECKGCLRFDPAAERPIKPVITAVTVRRIYCDTRLRK